MEHFYLASDLGWSYATNSVAKEFKIRVNGRVTVTARRYYHNVSGPAFGLETWELAQLFGGGN